MNSTNIFREAVPQKGGGGGMMAMGLVALVLIGVAVWYFFFRATKGCMTPGYKEYDVKYEEDTDPSACKTQQGCMKPAYTEYDVKYTEDTTPTACKTPVVKGCMESTATNYDPLANTTDATACTYAIVGCDEEEYMEYGTDDPCETPVVKGCADSTATNYDPLANMDDGSCTSAYTLEGCPDPKNQESYDPNDDNSCKNINWGDGVVPSVNYPIPSEEEFADYTLRVVGPGIPPTNYMALMQSDPYYGYCVAAEVAGKCSEIQPGSCHTQCPGY